MGAHTEETRTEDVRHLGAMLQALEVHLDRGAEPDRLLSVECISWSQEDGTPGVPLALLEPIPDTDGDVALDPDGLRAAAQSLRGHAAAMESFADDLEQLRG